VLAPDQSSRELTGDSEGKGDCEHLQSGLLEDDQPGRNRWDQRDPGDKIFRQRGRFESGPVKPGRDSSQHASDCRQTSLIGGGLAASGPGPRHFVRDTAWVIIGKFVSLSSPRLVATLAALSLVVIAAMGVLAASLPGSTWVALMPLPHQGSSAVFALAVDPTNDEVLVAGNSQGTLLRSTDGGLTWTAVHSGHAVVTTVAFDPYTNGLVLAGTRGSGAFASSDGGVTWKTVSGVDGRTVHTFGFTLTVMAAGTDHGVFLSQDGFIWTQSGLTSHNIVALAVAAIHSPVKLIAGSDAPASAGNAPMYVSADAGATWSLQAPALSGTVIVKLAAGPLPPKGAIRPLVAGTNAGLFQSADNGATFTPLSGGDLLPTVDYTQAAFVTTHYNRFYVASDGGGSGLGGLWRTHDAGHTFTSLSPPDPSITALAVSNDENPILYVATFRPSDHVVHLWAYRDTGGVPQGPVLTPTPVVSGVRASPSGGSSSALLDALRSSQAPYVGLGLAALIVILLAVVANFRGSRR
jgi:photosystem II stability/assembly factor-like uncharacterized protein